MLCSPRMLVIICQTELCHKPQDSVHSHRHKNLSLTLTNNTILHGQNPRFQALNGRPEHRGRDPTWQVRTPVCGFQRGGCAARPLCFAFRRANRKHRAGTRIGPADDKYTAGAGVTSNSVTLMQIKLVQVFFSISCYTNT